MNVLWYLKVAAIGREDGVGKIVACTYGGLVKSATVIDMIRFW